MDSFHMQQTSKKKRKQQIAAAMVLCQCLLMSPAHAGDSSSPGSRMNSDTIVGARESAPAQPSLIAEAPPVMPDEIDRLSALALTKEIELLRLNTNFRMETTDIGRLKPWRVFLYNLAGSGVATAGITTIAAERWRTWKTPAIANRNTLKAGPLLLLISHSIVLGGVLAEAGLDTIKDCKLKKRGFDPRATKKRALELGKEIDLVLSQRDTAIAQASLTDEQKAAAFAEGKILKDLRDVSLLEYCQFYARSQKRRVARDVSYLNGASAAATGGYLGSLCGFLAIADRNPRIAGPAGIGFMLSGAHIVAAPVLARLSGNWAARRASKTTSHEFGALQKEALKNMETHRQELRTLASLAPLSAGMLKRLQAYDGADELLENQAKMNAAEKKKADLEFKERLFFNTIVGGTKIAWGAQLSNAGFSFHQMAPYPAVRVPVNVGGTTFRVTLPKPHTPAQIFANRVAAGATTYIPGTGTWILDTLQARTRGEMDVYAMGLQEALPHQRLKKRLARLYELEELVAPPK